MKLKIWNLVLECNQRDASLLRAQLLLSLQTNESRPFYLRSVSPLLYGCLFCLECDRLLTKDCVEMPSRAIKKMRHDDPAWDLPHEAISHYAVRCNVRAYIIHLPSTSSLVRTDFHKCFCAPSSRAVTNRRISPAAVVWPLISGKLTVNNCVRSGPHTEQA